MVAGRGAAGVAGNDRVAGERVIGHRRRRVAARADVGRRRVVREWRECVVVDRAARRVDADRHVLLRGHGHRHRVADHLPPRRDRDRTRATEGDALV